MDDHLVGLIKAIRKAHRMSQSKVAECMHIAQDTYRHIEKGRRPLPDVFRGLVDWMEDFLTCVQATGEEREALVLLAARLTADEFSRLLDERPNSGGQPT
jgi:transcriptional regulator with XRE-family HTH domain